LGDPALRPDEDSLHVPTSFELERELREWEGKALVTWAMGVPPDTTARQLADAINADLRLHPGDVHVTRHRPEAFLIRFLNRRHCEDILSRGRFECRGAEVCVRPWRSLIGASGTALFYRVRIVLDGIPRHAWLPNLIERIVGRTCALQCIDTDLLHPTDTRGIELWARTATPNKISKVMWPGSVQIQETPPQRWQRGIKHRVLIHLCELHDYSGLTVDPHDENVLLGKPKKRRLTWYWGGSGWLLGAGGGAAAVPAPTTLPCAGSL
jgi:hypothetical protein